MEKEGGVAHSDRAPRSIPADPVVGGPCFAGFLLSPREAFGITGYLGGTILNLVLWWCLVVLFREIPIRTTS